MALQGEQLFVEETAGRVADEIGLLTEISLQQNTVKHTTSLRTTLSIVERELLNWKTKNIDRYYDAELLIIDDLGTEIVNNFTRSYLYEVINTRINNRKCTIINTNLSKNEIEERYSERITSRLFGEYFPIIFKGTDIRRQKIMK